MKTKKGPSSWRRVSEYDGLSNKSGARPRGRASSCRGRPPRPSARDRGDFELIDGVKNGVLEAMNSFTLYWAGKIPATAFLSSYLMGLRYPHEWDVFFYSKGGLQEARDIFAKQGIYLGLVLN